MADSMTGYGRAEHVTGDCRITVEIKSVNNRYGDVQMRAPRTLLFMETQIKERILERLVRGKMDLFVTLEDKREDGVTARINEPLVRAYSEALSRIATMTGREDRANAQYIASMPDVLVPDNERWDEAQLRANILQALDGALDEMAAMRAAEGSRLAEDLATKIAGIRQIVEQVSERATVVPEEYKKRLVERMKTLTAAIPGVNIDEGRLEAELLIFSDKCCIDEELVRLRSHLNQFDGILTQQGAVGKKLDFLLQEMGREINTIGSKGNDLILSGWVVEIKSELEKIREQVQNLV